MDGFPYEYGGSLMGNAIAMTDKDIFTIDVVGSTMACSLKLFFVTFEEDRAATRQHILSIAVNVRAVHGLAAAHCNSIVALRTTATVVP